MQTQVRPNLQAPAGRYLPAPLRYADFRALFLSTIFGGMGFRGELVVLGWYLLERTDSPFIVGLGVGVKMAPNLLVGILGGAIADRFDRRLLLRLYSFAMALNTGILGLLVLGEGPLALILLLTFSGGGIWALTQTTRQSYAVDVVGVADGLGGVALTHLGQRLGGVVGALAGGLIIAAWGSGEAFLALALSYLLAGAAILLARSKGQAAPAGRQGVWQNVREFSHELRHNRSVAALVLLTASVEIFGFSHLSVLPVLIRDVLDSGEGSLGLINALAGLGGMFAIAFMSMLTIRRRGPAFLGVLVVFGLSVAALGASNTLLLAIAAALVVNALAALSDVLSQGLLQLAVPNEMRGRASGAWTLAIGIAPLGHLQIGALSALLGVQTALVINGACLVLLAVLTAAGVRRLRQL